MPTADLLSVWLLLGWLAASAPRWASAQPTPGTRTTYYDAAHTQRRVVYGFVLRGTDTVAHGPFRRFWRSTGTLAELGHFTSGLADSTWTRYYPAAPGQPPALARRLSMQGGQPDGPFVVWHSTGQLAQRGTFRQGQLVDSVVTRTAQGQPRLLARLVPDSTGRWAPTGRFRQWYSGVTAQRFNPYTLEQRLSYNNPYPTTDPGRYWLGQLVAGSFRGALTEHDADGQLRVRQLYQPAGRVKLTTLYYPAAWVAHELAEQSEPPDGSLTSRPCWQVLRLGRDIVHEYYQWDHQKAAQQAVVRLVARPHLKPPTTCLQALLPLVALSANRPRLSARTALNPRYRYGPDLSLRLPPAHSKYGAAVDRRYKRASSQRLRKGRTRHLMGEADTLTGTFVRQRRLVKTDENGRSIITGSTLRLYNPDGSLSSFSRKKRRYEVERDYEHGRLVSYQKNYYDDDRQRIREWDDQGRLKYDARTNRHGTTYSRRRDRHGHMPLRRRLSRPMPMD